MCGRVWGIRDYQAHSISTLTKWFRRHPPFPAFCRPLRFLPWVPPLTSWRLECHGGRCRCPTIWHRCCEGHQTYFTYMRPFSLSDDGLIRRDSSWFQCLPFAEQCRNLCIKHHQNHHQTSFLPCSWCLLLGQNGQNSPAEPLKAEQGCRSQNLEASRWV